MAWVETRITRTTQPQDVCGLDAGHGSSFTFSAGAGNDDLSFGNKAVTGASLAKIPASKGIAAYTGGASGYQLQYPTARPLDGATSFTVEVLINAVSLGGKAFSQWDGTNVAWLVEVATDGSIIVGVGNGGPSSPIDAVKTTAGLAQAGKLTHIFWTWGGGDVGSSSVAYVDGVVVAPKAGWVPVAKTGTITSISNSSLTKLSIFGSTESGSGFNGQVFLARTYRRELDYAEVLRKTQNPYFDFEPEVQRVWVPDFTEIVAPTDLTGTGTNTTSATSTGAGIVSPLGRTGTGTNTATLTSAGAAKLAIAGAGAYTTVSTQASAGTLKASGVGANATSTTQAATAALKISGAAANTTTQASTGTGIVAPLGLAGSGANTSVLTSSAAAKLAISGAGSATTTQTSAGVGNAAPSATLVRPVSTTNPGAWTATGAASLHDAINEPAPSGAEYISVNSASTCTMVLSPHAHPGTANQTLAYRASSALGSSLTVALTQGGTTIMTRTHVLAGVDTLYTQTLTAGELALISAGAISVSLTAA